jgi:hypothetical protein
VVDVDHILLLLRLSLLLLLLLSLSSSPTFFKIILFLLDIFFSLFFTQNYGRRWWREKIQCRPTQSPDGAGPDDGGPVDGSPDHDVGSNSQGRHFLECTP